MLGVNFAKSTLNFFKYKGFVIIVATENCFILVLWNLRMLFV